MRKSPYLLCFALVTGPVVAQEVPDATALEEVLGGRPYSPYADRGYPTDVYFGDTHVHTGISADAGGSGTRLMPRDSYRLARGYIEVGNINEVNLLPYNPMGENKHERLRGSNGVYALKTQSEEALEAMKSRFASLRAAFTVGG